MGRPAETFPWTLVGNYPGSSFPWTGNPIAINPGVSFFTPNTKPPAQWFNWVIGQQQASIGGILDWSGQTPSANWWAPLAAASLPGGLQTEIGSAKWAPLAQKWIVGAGVHATPTVAAFLGNGSGADGASDWSAIGTAITPGASPFCCAVSEDNIAGQYWLVYLDSGFGQHIWLFSSGSWASTRSNTSATFGPSEIAVATIGSPAVLTVVVATAQSTNTIISHSTNDGVSWTDFSTNVGVVKPILKWNGSIFLVAGFSGSPVSPSTYWTSPDGVNWTARTFPAAVLGGGTIGGIAWDGSAWRMVCQNNAGTALVVSTSTDGINWSVVTTITTTVNLIDLAACGALLVASSVDGSTPFPSSLYYSYDGGVSWWRVQAGFATNSANSNAWYTRTRVWASNQGFLAHNTNSLRESLLAGQPATHL